MIIVVIAGGEDQKEFQDKEIPEGVQIQFVTTLSEAKEGADAYFYLSGEDELKAASENIQSLDVPVFVKGAVDLKTLPPNVAKISPWPGLLFAETIEVQLTVQNVQKVTEVLDNLQWKYQQVLVNND